MTLGLLPAAGGGIRDLQQAGQHVRLVEGYFRAYADTFACTQFFSYFDERLTDYTDDPRLLDRITVRPRRIERLPYRVYSLLLPVVYRRELAACDVVRVFQATGALPAVAARRWYGTPYAVTYGYRYAALAKTLGFRATAARLALVERLALHHAAAVIVTTAELRSYVEEIVAPERVHLIPNGVDTERFAGKRREPGERDTATVIFVGRLEAQKNVASLIEAMRLVRARRRARLVLVGRGSRRRALERQAIDLGVEVEFAGVVEHSVLPDRLRAADVFVLPSLVEGHTKALLEAMACGLPCVVSDCEGNREVVRDGENGLLARVDDAEALAERIGHVLEDGALARGLGQRARETVIREYDLRALLDREVALLRGIARPRA